MKLLVSDFDGTLFRNWKITPEEIDAIKEWRNRCNLFAIATGRQWYDLMDREIGDNVDYIIFANGAKIVDENRKLIYKNGFDISLFDKILRIADNYEPNGCEYTDDDRELHQMTVWFRNLDEARVFKKGLEKEYGDILNIYENRAGIGMDIVSAKATKAVGIYELAKMHNIKKEDIYTVGDSPNDLVMLREFNGYCIASADDDIKSEVNNICPDLAQLINEII